MNETARVHGATGMWLGLVLIAHVMFGVAGPATAREAASIPSIVVLAIELALVLLPLILHAVSGLMRTRTTPNEYPSVGLRVMQQVTGLLTLIGYVVIAGPALLAIVQTGSTANGYDALREQLDRVPMLALAVTATTCACFHLAQGLSRQLPGHDSGRLPLRPAALVVAVLVWILAIDGTAYLASGRALLFTREPAPVQDRDAPSQPGE